MTTRKSKPYRLILATIIMLQLVIGIPHGSLAADPTPPTPVETPVLEENDDGPLDGAESDPNSLYSRLVGDHPTDPDWYQLPSTAFLQTDSGILASGVEQVAGGLSHTCALTSEGGVKCWGDNWEGKLGNGTVVDSYTPVDVIGLTSGVVAISASHKHTCALTESGGMKCWGRNWHGELGDGTTAYRVTPVDVFGLTSGVKGIAAGGFHTCALLVDGNIKCWGANWHGQVGDDSKTQRLLPVDVVGLAGPAKAIAAGKYHTCALLESGALQCWGYNLYGQLGNNSLIDRPVPQDVYYLTEGVQAVSLGENHSCALTGEGEAMCWGNNLDGQLGDGTIINQLIPVFTAGLDAGNQAIQAGQRFTCTITALGSAKCWGENWAGQLGNGGQTGQLLPVDVAGLSYAVTALGAGDSHSCAVLATQGLMCWGSNGFGQIGTGDAALRLQPVSVSGLNNGIAVIVSGGAHSCALTTGGGVKCWGDNEFGQLGNGTTVSSVKPVDVFSLDDEVTAIAAGGFHTCAAFREEVRCWGYNEYGQLGDGSKATRLTPETVVGISSAVSALAAGSNHTCAIMADTDVIKCWGQNKNGQLGNGSKIDYPMALLVEGVDGLRFRSLTTGDRHTCAATMLGNVWCWGFNEDGQLGNGTTELSTLPVEVLNLYHEIAAVSAGMSHTCGVTYDGRIKCWGDNTYGELGDGTLNRQLTPVETLGLGGAVIQIGAGGFHTCAVLTDGSSECWGNNQTGQLGDGTTFMHLLPTDVNGMNSPISYLGAGAYTTCVTTSLGEAQCWGAHGNGQIGDGTIPWELEPRSVINLITSSLTINYPNGQPGSYFTIIGEDLPPDIPVTVKVNNLELAPLTVTDSDGRLAIIMDTTLAEPGSYIVTITALRSYNIKFSLEESADYHPQEGSGVVYQVPAGIALTLTGYLPFSIK